MPKPPIHLWSEDGCPLSLALKLQGEGHPVTLDTKNPEAAQVGKGLVPRATEPPKGALVIFDTVGHGDLGDLYRKRGHAVIGGNRFDADLELNRPKGARIMREAGITTPATFPFKTTADAIAFLKKSEGAWFVKVSGAQADCMSTYNASNPDAMIRYLRWCQNAGPVEPFELQSQVDGIEVSCNGWFNGREFVPPFDLTIEEKRFLTGDLGPRTGCASCVVWHADGDELAERTVLKIEEVLGEQNYVGPVDCNSLVDSDGEPTGLEWTARIGFDSTQAWMRLFGDDLGEQLVAFAHRELGEWEPLGERLALNLRVSVPPYPTFVPAEVRALRGLPLDGMVVGEWFDPSDVMQGPVCAGASGWIGVVGVTGSSLAGLQHSALTLAQTLQIPNSQYRTDPVSRGARDMKRLDQLGLLGLKEWR
jgi:phosphoribosylamine---glycine ligase